MEFELKDHFLENSQEGGDKAATWNQKFITMLFCSGFETYQATNRRVHAHV